MNLSTIALLLLAWQLFSGSNTQQQPHANSPLSNISDFLSDDTKNMIDCVDKLSSKQCSQEDKTGAILQMMTNPAVINLASNLFAKTNTQTTCNNDANNKETAKNGVENNTPNKKANTNDEGYQFATPSSDSREFFRPIDNIADTEIKHKLYWFYDNWYVK